MENFITAVIELISGSYLQQGSLYLLRNIPGFPPVIQTVHILGIAVVMGSVVMIDLRVLGLAVPGQAIGEMTKRLMPWLWWALISNFVSGAVFVLARPNRYFNNPVFGWKFSFLVPAVLLTLVFHLLSRRQADYWTSSQRHLLAARLLAILSLGLWIMVAMAGRWIAYSEYIYFPAEPF